MLVPRSPSELDPIVKLANRAVTGTERHDDYRWFVRAKALAEYRSGHDANAIDWLKRFSPRADGIHSDAQVFALLAMARQHLGQSAAARDDLTRAQAILAKHMPDPAAGRPFGDAFPYRLNDCHDWLHARILCREACALLGVETETNDRPVKAVTG
jgi:hypothetical protein